MGVARGGVPRPQSSAGCDDFIHYGFIHYVRPRVTPASPTSSLTTQSVKSRAARDIKHSTPTHAPRHPEPRGTPIDLPDIPSPMLHLVVQLVTLGLAPMAVPAHEVYLTDVALTAPPAILGSVCSLRAMQWTARTARKHAGARGQAGDRVGRVVGSVLPLLGQLRIERDCSVWDQVHIGSSLKRVVLCKQVIRVIGLKGQTNDSSNWGKSDVAFFPIQP